MAKLKKKINSKDYELILNKNEIKQIGLSLIPEISELKNRIKNLENLVKDKDINNDFLEFKKLKSEFDLLSEEVKRINENSINFEEGFNLNLILDDKD